MGFIDEDVRGLSRMVPMSSLLVLDTGPTPQPLRAVVSTLIPAVERKRSRFDMMPKPEQAYVECTRLVELPFTHLCVFNYKIFMNAALNRASYYVEQKRTVLGHDEHLKAVITENIEGHDLKSVDLERYRADFIEARPGLDRRANQAFDGQPSPPAGAGQAGRAGNSHAGIATELGRGLLRIEAEFWDRYVVPEMISPKDAGSGPERVLIAVGADSDLEATLSHEVMHAQYFQDPRMRRAVKEFWETEVGERDKDAIRKALAPSYDVNDDDLLMNEFQAYMLMASPEKRILKEFTPRYRDALRTFLKAVKIEPIADNLGSS